MEMNKTLLVCCMILSSILLLTSCNESSETVPLVSYSDDVAPIFTNHCVTCHNTQGEGYVKSGLNMESHQSLMAGTKFGPIIVPGDSLASTLVVLINGKADPSINMPHGSVKLLAEQDRKTIALWIDQGARNN